MVTTNTRATSGFISNQFKKKLIRPFENLSANIEVILADGSLVKIYEA